MEWLKIMVQPFQMHLLIPLREVGKLWGIPEHQNLGTRLHTQGDLGNRES